MILCNFPKMRANGVPAATECKNAIYTVETAGDL